MADDKTPQNASDPPEQTKPEQADQHQQEQQPQAAMTAPPDRPPAPGRKPLFRS